MNSRTRSKDSSSSDASLSDRQKNRLLKKYEKTYSMALKLLSIVVRNCRRRLVMESFMKLRLQYQFRLRQRSQKPKSAQSSHEMLSQRNHNQSWMSKSNRNSNVSQLATERNKLIHDIARKLEGAQKRTDAHISSSVGKNLQERQVNVRLDRLQKMLKSIKKCHIMSSQASLIYSHKMEPNPAKAHKFEKDVNEFSLMDAQKNQMNNVSQLTYDRQGFKKDFQNLQRQLSQLKRVNEECIKRSERSREGQYGQQTMQQPMQQSVQMAEQPYQHPLPPPSANKQPRNQTFPTYPTFSAIPPTYPQNVTYIQEVSYEQPFYPTQLLSSSVDPMPLHRQTAKSFVIPTRTHIYTEIPTGNFVYEFNQPQFREVIRPPVQQSFVRYPIQTVHKPRSCQRLYVNSRTRYF